MTEEHPNEALITSLHDNKIEEVKAQETHTHTHTYNTAIKTQG